jgi:hypothetical protein
VGTLADAVGTAISGPVLSAGVFRTPVTTRGGFGVGSVLVVGAGWIWRRWRSPFPNYVVLACTARDLLAFDVGRRIDEIGSLLRREPLHTVRAYPDRAEQSHFVLVVDGKQLGWFTSVTVDVATRSLVDLLTLAPEARSLPN